MKIETIAIHAGNKIDTDYKAVIQPLVLSTTFERGEDGGYPGSFAYTRTDNPNRKSLENVLAQLEGGEDCCTFSSGNAAGTAVFQALAPGSHVIAPDDMYHGLKHVLTQLFHSVLEVDFVDMTNPDAIKSVIKDNTRLIWIETPSNPLLKVCDIGGITAMAKGKNILVACDNTFATPVFQQPLNLGCDMVMHSTTKYFSGHSDSLGGALITSEKDDFWEKIRNIQVLAGAVPSPFDCYLTIRGIKTLPYRMHGHAQNAMKLAEWLRGRDIVTAVFYPGLTSHENHEIAKKQMSGFSGVLSFLVSGGEETAKKIVNSVKLFLQATSLGGVESLIEHRASVEGPDTKTPPNLIRISVGLEHIDDLIADLDQAFKNT